MQNLGVNQHFQNLFLSTSWFLLIHIIRITLTSKWNRPFCSKFIADQWFYRLITGSPIVATKHSTKLCVYEQSIHFYRQFICIKKPSKWEREWENPCLFSMILNLNIGHTQNEMCKLQWYFHVIKKLLNLNSVSRLSNQPNFALCVGHFFSSYNSTFQCHAINFNLGKCPRIKYKKFCILSILDWSYNKHWTFTFRQRLMIEKKKNVHLIDFRNRKIRWINLKRQNVLNRFDSLR